MNKIVIFFFVLICFSGCSIDFEKGDGKKYALIYGINNYLYVSPPLNFAVSDAVSMSSSLKNYGFNVVLRTDSEATKSSISNDLANLVFTMNEEDTLLFYFSGHGYRTGGISYIVPYDTSITNLNSMLSEVELFEWLKDVKTDKVLLIFDHCYSGAYIAKNRFFVMTASKADEEAAEISSIGHGLFTYYFLNGLENKKADINEDNHISFSEIFYFVEYYVTNYGYQTPQFLGNKTVEYVLF
ncbi:MAG: caspase family protein [Brevinematia bacterium]